MLYFHHSNILYVGSWVAWLYHLFHPLWFGTWRFSYFCDQTSIFSIIDQFDICDTSTLIPTYTSGPCSDDSLCTFSSAILVYILDLFCTFYMDIFLTNHGYARLRHELTLCFLSLVFGRLKSGEFLSCPCEVLSMHIIHFGHHVPLLTSYIRGHLL